MKVNNIVRSILGAISIALFVSTGMAQTQPNRYVICNGRQAWLVSSPAAISVGKCSNTDWVFPLKIAELESSKKQKPTHDERQALAVLRRTLKQTPILVPLTETQLGSIISGHLGTQEVVISAKSLPAYAREFFSKTDILKNGMYFKVSSGNWFTDTDQYKEAYRWMIIVPGDNPTIGDILKEVKQELGDNPLLHKEYLYLVLPRKSEPLDNAKRAADYNLKDGSILWLGSHVR